MNTPPSVKSLQDSVRLDYIVRHVGVAQRHAAVVLASMSPGCAQGGYADFHACATRAIAVSGLSGEAVAAIISAANEHLYEQGLITDDEYDLHRLRVLRWILSLPPHGR